MRYLAFAILVIAILACGSTKPAAPAKVIYKIDGSKNATVFITYQNETGATTQIEAKVPWENEFTVKPGQFTYVSAQLRSTWAYTVTCGIDVNGKTLQVARSAGKFVIATCSGSAK